MDKLLSNERYQKYRKLVDTYSNSDWREVNFQNRIILPLLDEIFEHNPFIQVVDVSTQYKNKESVYHTREHYAWDYTPDLLLAKQWHYYNKEMKKTDYLAVMEIKSPILAPIQTHCVHTNEEIKEYLKHIDKVILSDCYQWKFYNKTTDPVVFTLHDKTGWIDSVSEHGNSSSAPQEWTGLIDYIKTFLEQP